MFTRYHVECYYSENGEEHWFRVTEMVESYFDVELAYEAIKLQGYPTRIIQTEHRILRYSESEVQDEPNN